MDQVATRRGLQFEPRPGEHREARQVTSFPSRPFLRTGRHFRFETRATPIFAAPDVVMGSVTTRSWTSGAGEVIVRRSEITSPARTTEEASRCATVHAPVPHSLTQGAAVIADSSGAPVRARTEQARTATP